MDDPIVSEVRRVREEIFARFDYDLEKYMRYLSEQERQHPERVITLEQWRQHRSAAAATRQAAGQEPSIS